MNMIELEWAPWKCLHLAYYTVDMATNIHIEGQNEPALSQHCLSNVQHPMETDLITMRMKTYIIHMHRKEIKTILVLPWAKLNKKSNFTIVVEYISVTWVPCAECNVSVHDREEIGSLCPIMAVLHTGALFAGSACFPDHSLWAESIPD